MAYIHSKLFLILFIFFAKSSQIENTHNDDTQVGNMTDHAGDKVEHTRAEHIASKIPSSTEDTKKVVEFMQLDKARINPLAETVKSDADQNHAKQELNAVEPAATNTSTTTEKPSNSSSRTLISSSSVLFLAFFFSTQI